ncbi:MAG: HlyD family efflux transporter periplasmic adaptor subunit [Microbacteriaceae bacterium]|nr:HlyD family efflux transporter periplasmic adaptor subunit [Microbacteriaceae bacterium]
MTWSNRLRLLGGALLVLVIVAACTIVFTQREGQVASRTASFEAVSYSVGSDYAGTVTEQFVDEGAAVAKGDKLLSVQSATLLSALDSPQGVPENTAYTVANDGTLTLIATEPGILKSVEAQVGGFVGAGQALATVERDASIFVLADFVIDPYNFTRIEDGARVEVVLPDHQRLEATVAKKSVDTVNGKANVELEISSEDFIAGEMGGLVASGTPVTAILHLREEGPLAGVKDSLYQLLEQVGI